MSMTVTDASGQLNPAIQKELIALLPRLRRFARVLSGTRDEADDLVQAACERALRAIGGFEPGSRLDSWMFRILRNLWIDQLRRRKAERISEASDFELDSMTSEDGRHVTEQRLELAHVRTVIAGLPADQREVLALVCIEDLRYAEAAATLRVPIGTVMSRLGRARQALARATGRERTPTVRAHAMRAGPYRAADVAV